ncbi:hypothetical protein HRG84_16080 [Flavisolibacter sp. BT320]|nr:hypothetical protein [Flavisolibacter longurius]
MKKPVSPTAHGVIDYVFSAVQAATPFLLSLNPATKKTYAALSTGFTVVNALTNTKAGIKPVIPFRGHQKADVGFLVGLGLLSFAGFIRNDKRSRLFHLAFLGLGLAHYLLTDYKQAAAK